MSKNSPEEAQGLHLIAFAGEHGVPPCLPKLATLGPKSSHQSANMLSKYLLKVLAHNVTE